MRQAIGDATSEATTAQRRLAATEDDDVLTTLRLAHSEIIDLTDVERAQFTAAVAPVVEEQRQRSGDRLFSYLES